MSHNIDELQEVSNKLAERIAVIDQFNSDEAKFGEFIQQHILDTYNLIPVESVVAFVMRDSVLALKGLILMNKHLCDWKDAIDSKIIELKSEEFPSEITL